MSFELRKCVGKRSAVLGILFLVIWGLILPMLITYGYWQVNRKAGYETKSDVVKQIAKNEQNGLSVEAIAQLERKEYEDLKKSQIPPLLQELFYESAARNATLTNVAQSYYFYGTSDMYIRKLQQNGKARSVSAVQRKQQEQPGAYYDKQFSMLQAVGKPQAEFTRFMEYYENFTNVSMVVIITFLFMVFSNTGSQEYSSNMHLILYSTPINKMKIFINKILSIIVVGSSAMILLDVCHFAIFFGVGYGKNLDARLNCLSLEFVYCPYHISVLEYFLLKFVFGQLTILVLAVVIVFISMKWKSSMITIAVTGAFTLGGYAAAVIGFEQNIFVRYSLAGGVKPSLLFQDFYAAKFGDAILLYPVIYTVWLLVILFVGIRRLFVLAGNVKSGKRHRRTENG